MVHENILSSLEFWWQEILGVDILVLASPYIAKNLGKWLIEEDSGDLVKRKRIALQSRVAANQNLASYLCCEQER